MPARPSESEKEVAVIEPDYAGAYSAFLSLLKENQDDILATINAETQRVALFDVYGDEIPELFFITAPEAEYGHVYGYLQIYTYETGSTRCLYSIRVVVAAGAGSDYCVCGSTDTKGIILYVKYPGEDESDSMVISLSGNWEEAVVLAESTAYYSQGTQDASYTYTVHGDLSDSYVYEAAIAEAMQPYNTVILAQCREYRTPQSIISLMQNSTSLGMSFDAAADLLNNQ